GGSKLDAFSVDTETRYKGESSMRFDVPNVGNPDGSFAGAIFPDMGGRDLSGYDALTFWAKATKAATINEIGFGNDFGENKYVVTKENLRISTGWTKYIIPIPDPSKLMREKGLFWYSEGPEDGDGYTFWIDELRFENLGTIAQPQPAILGGQDVDQQAFVDIDISLTGLTQTFNLASGINQTVTAAPSYFNFQSSDNDVARVSELGVVSPVGTGTVEITAILGGVRAEGSLSLDVAGGFVFAPTPPARDPANVISIFSDAYANVPVDFYNGFFAPFQTTLGGAIDVNGNNIIEYTELNFVATEFKNPTVDASAMTHFHVDIRIDETIDSADFIAIELGDFGPNDAFGGGDDSSSRITFDSSSLVSGEWISLDIPLSDFTTLTSRSNLAQIFFISDATISGLLVDNMYFYTE
ncbi:MAG: hypothetical protein HKP08_11455, partial [Flavobacteriaceae bacterium]|nr:hypothetical protein [Flavobacteriaceae bacterium]